MGKKNVTKDKSKNLKQNKLNKQPVEDDLKDFFKQKHTAEQKPTVKPKSLEEVEADIKRADHETLNKILTNTLAPHLGENEGQKRVFKKTLLKGIQKMLWCQLMFVAIPIIMVFLSLCTKCPFMREIPNEIVLALFEFIKYYITAIIAELLSMLLIIVNFVFDKSIVSLVKEMVKK